MRLYGERVYGAVQFVGQDAMDETLALEARETLERAGYDFHLEVGFTAFAGACMPFMAGGFIDHHEALRVERVFEFLR